MSLEGAVHDRYARLTAALEEVEVMLDAAERHAAWASESARHPDLPGAHARVREQARASRRRVYSLHVHFENSHLTDEQLGAFVDLLEREYSRVAGLLGEAYAVLVRLGVTFPSGRAARAEDA